MDDGGQAFPMPANEHTLPERGMTLRDYFAGQALAGMGHWTPTGYSLDPKSRAYWAYVVADEMLEARREL